jgi:hypothetical protein
MKQGNNVNDETINHVLNQAFVECDEDIHRGNIFSKNQTTWSIMKTNYFTKTRNRVEFH